MNEQPNTMHMDDSAKMDKRFKTLIEHSYDSITLMDANGYPTYQSPSSGRIMGWTLEERRELAAFAFIHPDDLVRLKVLFRQALENPGKPIYSTHRIRHKDGHYILAEGVITNMLDNPDVGAVVSNFRDITAKRQAEDAHRSAETNYRELFEKANDAIYVHDHETGRVLEVNQRACEITGFTKDEIISADPREFITDHPDYSFEHAMNYIQKAASGEPQRFDWLGKKKDNSGTWLEVNLKRATIAGQERILAFFHEINDRKKAEEELSELNRTLEKKVLDRTDQLQAMNKEMESFTYSVSHDLRAPLRAVAGFAGMLEEDYSAAFDDEGARRLRVIIANAERMGHLIDDLLTFSRLGKKSITATDTDMKQLTESVISEVNRSMAHNATINVGELHDTRCDKALMNQVMINLVSNAIKYSSKKEHPQIDIKSRTENDEVIYSVQDNGAGFDMRYAGKLFGVFQRLHSANEFEGTGVGLAIVNRIIKKHHGKVWADSKPGEGATFYFSIPANLVTEAETT